MPVRGPRLKIVRRLGTPLPGLTRKTPDEGEPAHRAGQAPQRRRRQPSAYGRGLLEKQKVRLNYGVSERQLRRYLEAAQKLPGKTGETLLAFLERRLDNVVFRLGLAPTIPAARQLIAHGHVRVRGQCVDRASYIVRTGDEVSLSPRARQRPTLAVAAEQGPLLRLPSYLTRDPDDPFTGRVISTPARADVPFPVRETLIVEFYAR